MKKLALLVMILVIFLIQEADAKWPAVNSNVPGVDGQVLINNGGNVGAKDKDSFVGMRSVQEDGALCNGSHDDTVAIQDTINYCKINKCTVFIPSSLTQCRVTAPLIIYPSNGLSIIGEDRVNSKIYCEQANDCIVTGDYPGTQQARDFTLKNVSIFQTSTNAKWGVNCKGSANMVIEQVLFANASTQASLATSGNISLTYCIVARIMNNYFINITYGQVGIYGVNSTNAIWVSGNRMDGTNTSNGTAIYIFGAAYTILGNTFQSLKTGVKLGASFGVHIAGNYFETIGVSILSDVPYTEGIGILDNFVSCIGGVNSCFDLGFLRSAHISGNEFYGRPTVQYNGKYIAINADHTSNKDWIVGPNALGLVGGSNPAVDEEIELNVRYALHNIDLVSEHVNFIPKDILQDSFKAWTTTPGAPNVWTAFGAGSVRTLDSPVGQYSAEIQAGSANANGILYSPLYTISATKNANLRGSRVMFCFWLKESTGGGSVQVQLLDGGSGSTVSYISTPSWVRQCQGMKIDAAATGLGVIISGLSASKAHFVAGPSLYIGTTLPLANIETP